MHDPIEKLFELVERVTTTTPLFDENHHLVVVDEPGGSEAGSKSVEQSVSSSSGWGVAATFDISEYIPFLGLDYNYSVSNETTTTTTSTLSQDVPYDSYVYAMVTHIYHRHHQFLSKYKPEGRDVRLARYGGLDANEPQGVVREVPHEAFADEFQSVSVPFWSELQPDNQPQPHSPEDAAPRLAAPTSTYRF